MIEPPSEYSKFVELAGPLFGLLSCFILSSFFSGSEAALLSINADRIRQLIKEGGPRARALDFMLQRSSELLTTILIGNNLANILAASLATTLATEFFANDAVSISVGLTTLIILIFGEIIPKTFARRHAERLVVTIIWLLKINYYLF